jgi:hypothetical protein
VGGIVPSAIQQKVAAERLGVHPNTVGAMLTDGRLRPVVVGSVGGPKQPVRRVDSASLARLLDHDTPRAA